MTDSLRAADLPTGGVVPGDETVDTVPQLAGNKFGTFIGADSALTAADRIVSGYAAADIAQNFTRE